MRFQIDLLLKDKKLSSDYKRKILSLFKNVITKRHFEEIYGEHKIRSFTFSPYIKVDKFNGDEISLKSNEIKIFLSVDDNKEAWIFLNSFKQAKGKSFSFGENEIEVVGIKTLNEKKIEEDIAVFKTMSPIAIREKLENGKDWYHDMDEKGVEVLKKNIGHQLRYDFPKSLLEGIKIKPLKVKRTVVKNYSIKFPVTLGSFIIEADSRVLNLLYKRGIGSKTSLGHGMLEILDY